VNVGWCVGWFRLFVGDGLFVCLVGCWLFLFSSFGWLLTMYLLGYLVGWFVVKTQKCAQMWGCSERLAVFHHL